ncbi:hypothetical protein JOM56_006781 [Amanita muscaria]
MRSVPPMFCRSFVINSLVYNIPFFLGICNLSFGGSLYPAGEVWTSQRSQCQSLSCLYPFSARFIALTLITHRWFKTNL